MTFGNFSIHGLDYYLSHLILRCDCRGYAMNIVTRRNDACVFVRISICHPSPFYKQLSGITNKSPYSWVSHTRYAYSTRKVHMT